MPNIDVELFSYVYSYYQSSKAFWARSRLAYDDLQKCDTPKQAWERGNKINPFDVQEWDEVAVKVMTTVVYAKFLHNENLRQKLLDTGDRLLIEAESGDRTWSTGLGIVQTKSTMPSSWPGRNLLGEILMDVRDTIRDHSEFEDVWVDRGRFAMSSAPAGIHRVIFVSA